MAPLIPISPCAVGVRLLVDSVHYATFVDRDSAEAAVLALRERWPAAKGKRLKLVDPVTDEPRIVMGETLGVEA